MSNLSFHVWILNFFQILPYILAFLDSMQKHSFNCFAQNSNKFMTYNILLCNINANNKKF
jgi:hypothetical protein